MFEMDKFEEFYKQHCLDHFGYDPDLNWIFEKHEDGSYIQIEVENAKKVFNHQQAKVEELQVQLKGAEERAQLVLKYKDKYRLERDELQKRVDQAEKLIQKWNGGGYDIFDVFKQIEQALKGDG